ncbi:alpha/beta fold hydrolase [Camelliibacillus cellulosilyticus]|uniref:Alpha/beta fold hydrolase n=1 Tax=Camelliibacillus cellulosilyticus TaxID=2174486 RepID=A0ABV9GNW1_9BACL
MLVIKDTQIAGIPAIQVEEAGADQQALPLFIFWHGWTSGNESHMNIAYLAAKRGFRVVLPDAVGHNSRLEALSEEERNFGFWQVVLQSIHETNRIKDYFIEEGLIQNGRIALAGSSMGAVITLGSLAVYDWIQAAGSLMGTPYYEAFARHLVEAYRQAGITLPYSDEKIEALIRELEPYDLGRNPDRLNGRPIFFWHGQADQTVPYKESRRFYEKLMANGYKNATYLTDEKADHKVSREAAFALVDWLKTHL